MKLSDFKVVLFDVDGVLTDGSLYYSESGEAIKVFNARDGVSVGLLKTAGLKVGLLSAKKSGPLQRRAMDLNYDYCFFGIEDKLAQVDELVRSEGISYKEVAFVGDDIVDVPVMAVVGLSAAPRDAHAQAVKRADWHLEANGGQGVAREFADRFLSECGANLDELYATMTDRRSGAPGKVVQ